MAKSEKQTKTTREPKTIKVSTVVISVLVLLGLIAAFIGGIAYNENFNTQVNAQAVELSKKLES